MKFLRSKAAVIAIGVMTLLCLVAMGISVRISFIMLERRDQLVKYGAADDKQPVYQSDKQPNMSRLKEKTLFYNGERCEDAAVYVDDKGNFFVPIDYFLKKIGAEVRFYESDDIIEYYIDGNKTVIRLGDDMATISNMRVKLSVPPVGAKNHILVPEELLLRIPGFTADLTADGANAHIGYYKDIPRKAGRLRVLKKTSQFAYITDMNNEKLIWNTFQDFTSANDLYIASVGDHLIVKSHGDVYLFDRNESQPRRIDVVPDARLSADGELLYWVDWNHKTSFIYDIESDKTIELGDYYFRLFEDEEAGSLILGNDVLYNYEDDGESRRIILTNKAHEGNYSFIEREGGNIIQGSFLYSPDGSRIIFSKDGKGYFTATSKGKEISFIGNGVEVRWVNNNRIFLRTYEGEMLIYTIDQKKAERVETDWRKVGQAADGGIFYTASGYLHYENGGKETSLMEIPEGCDFVFAGSSEGSYITVCNSKDSVNYVVNGEVIRLGTYSSLLGRIDFADSRLQDNMSFTMSPDGSVMAAFFRADGLVKMKLMESGKPDITDIVLNIPTADVDEVEQINTRWLSDDVMLLYTAHKGWIINMKEHPDIYSWSEYEGTVIQAIIP